MAEETVWCERNCKAVHNCHGKQVAVRGKYYHLEGKKMYHL